MARRRQESSQCRDRRYGMPPCTHGAHRPSTAACTRPPMPPAGLYLGFSACQEFVMPSCAGITHRTIHCLPKAPPTCQELVILNHSMVTHI